MLFHEQQYFFKQQTVYYASRFDIKKYIYVSIWFGTPFFYACIRNTITKRSSSLEHRIFKDLLL